MYVFIVGVVIIAITGYLIGISSRYNSSVLISKINAKIHKYNSLDAVLISYGIVLLISIPVLYIFDFADLIPLALSMGIFSLIIFFFSNLLKK